MSIFSGYIYDMWGRRAPIFMAGLILASVMLLVPYSAPSIIGLTALKVVFSIACAQLGSHPLIMDSIKKEDRAKGSAL